MHRRILLMVCAIVCACALSSCAAVSDIYYKIFAQDEVYSETEKIPETAENVEASDKIEASDNNEASENAETSENVTAAIEEDGGNTVSDNNTNPIVTIEMESGDIIKLELYPDKAPNTVANFVTLAKEGFYNGVVFHRVIYGFMIQGGDPTGTGMGGPGYNIKGEMYNNGNEANDIQHEAGVISMARSQSYNSAGSQFFIMHMDAPHLDKEYCAFGKVIEGMENVNKIAESPTGGAQGSSPKTPIVMKSVTVDDKGVEYTVVKN